MLNLLINSQGQLNVSKHVENLQHTFACGNSMDNFNDCYTLSKKVETLLLTVSEKIGNDIK